MILDNSETKIVSSQGWADKSSFCVIDTNDESVSNFNLENADYVTVQKLKNEHFMCLHHFKGEKLIITIHSFDVPDKAIGRMEIEKRKVKVDGDGWQYAPRFIVEWLKDGMNDDYYLLELNPSTKNVRFHPIEWFHAEEYDRGYQGLYQVVEIPNSDLLLFPIQRSSSPVLYNFKKQRVEGKLKLAGRSGNPLFQFRNNQSELWTVDYDTLVSLEVGSWKILHSKKFQSPTFGHTMTFVGELAFTPDEKYCALTRPYSKDALLLQSENMKEIGKIKTKFQPLQVALLSNLKCVYRDWQTGNFNFQPFSL